MMMESYFSSKNMEFLSKYKKKSDQQTAVFIKLIVLSYSDVLLSNFFLGSSQLLILSHELLF